MSNHGNKQKWQAYAGSADKALGDCEVVSQEYGGDRQKPYKNQHTEIYLLRVPVHEGHDNQCGEEKRGEKRFPAVRAVNVVAHECKHPHNTAEAFHNRIAGGDFRTAGVALSAKEEPAEKRYQVSLADFCTAGHAVGGGFYKRFSRRQAVNAYIEKAPYAYAEKEYYYVYSYHK